MPGPAFVALAGAIDRKIPSGRAAELLADYFAEVRREAAAEIRTDADLRDAEDLLAEARYGRELADLIDRPSV